MYGIFVNEDGGIHYADAIVRGYKPVETRSRNMLRSLVGQRVAIVRTRRGKQPTIIGEADIVSASFQSAQWLDEHRDETLIPPGSKHDCKGKGKWCYTLVNAVRYELPVPLPKAAIRHGRSFCEFRLYTADNARRECKEMFDEGYGFSAVRIFLNDLVRGEDITPEERHAIMGEIFDGKLGAFDGFATI